MRAMSRYSLVEAVGGPELDAPRIRIGQDFGAAILADVFRIVADQPVALTGDAVLQLTGGGELEAFLDAALGLELGHFRLLVAPLGRRYRTATAALTGRAVRFSNYLECAAPIRAESGDGKERVEWILNSRSRNAASRPISRLAPAGRPMPSNSTRRLSALRS